MLKPFTLHLYYWDFWLFQPIQNQWKLWLFCDGARFFNDPNPTQQDEAMALVETVAAEETGCREDDERERPLGCWEMLGG